VAGITARTMSEYVVWRRSNIRRGTGDRSADIQLAALSSLCQWAQFDGRIAANPFSKRPRFQDSAAVRHCHEAMPETDEILHRLLTWFFTRTADVPSAALQHSPDTRRITAGAWLAFTALTGLRPQEPQELWLLPNMTQTPDSLKSLQPGQCFPTRDGQMRMKVVRYKRGQNPFVILTPAALDFLRVWTEWLVGVRHTSYSMPTKRLFPNVDDPTRPFCAGSDTSPLNKLLNDACRACAVPPCRPKGLGRAFYVRVRRSQGADDATIAGELGQTTNGELIRKVYGDPDDMLHGSAYDWLPDDQDRRPTDPAWNLLKTNETPANVIRL
jgi:integrase